MKATTMHTLIRNNMRTRLFFPSVFSLIAFFVISGCDNPEDENILWPAGNFDKGYIQELEGFFDQKNTLLAAAGMSNQDFISFSTDSAWSLGETNRNKLKQLRESIDEPTGSILLQKVITLQDVATYMNNTYGGTVGGFVSVAGDVKSLSTMHDIYYGLRLDYSGTKFLPEGAGYAVLRFTSNNTDKLNIPFCVEMGGTNAHSWPNTGGGFTSSTLGEGGFPEYTFSNYFAPNQGGELYEVTTLGNEILRATFEGTKWVTTEPSTRSATVSENPVKNGLYGLSGKKYYPLLSYPGGLVKIQLSEGKVGDYSGAKFYISSQADYLCNTYRVWYGDEDHYFLTTSRKEASGLYGFEIVERNKFGKMVPIREISNFREIISIE